MTNWTIAFACLLGTVLMLAADAKRRSPEEFRIALRSQGWLPKRLVSPVARALPVAEAICAILLLVPVTRQYGGLISAALFAVFSVVALRAVVRHSGAPCGCFGAATEEPMSWLTVCRNAGLFALATFVALFGGAQGGAVILPSMMLGLGLGLLVVLAEQWRAVLKPNWLRD